MLKDVTLLFIGAILSLGPAVTAMAAPLYFPKAPQWIWHYAFWLGIAMFTIMLGDGLLLLLVKNIRYGTLALGSIGLFFLAWSVVHQTQKREEVTRLSDVTTKPWKHTLADLFKSDFPDTLKLGKEFNLGMPGSHDPNVHIDLKINIQLCQDYSAGGEFFEVFIESANNTNSEDQTYKTVIWLGDNLPKIRDEWKASIETNSSSPGSSVMSSNELSFTGRIYIYTMYSFDAVQIGELVSYFRAKNMKLDIRGNDYWFANRNR